MSFSGIYGNRVIYFLESMETPNLSLSLSCLYLFGDAENNGVKKAYTDINQHIKGDVGTVTSCKALRMRSS